MINNNLGCGLLRFTLYRQQFTLCKKKREKKFKEQLYSLKVKCVSFSKVKTKPLARPPQTSMMESFAKLVKVVNYCYKVFHLRNLRRFSIHT